MIWGLKKFYKDSEIHKVIKRTPGTYKGLQKFRRTKVYIGFRFLRKNYKGSRGSTNFGKDARVLRKTMKHLPVI